MKLGILLTDDVAPDLVPTFGAYPEMFARLLSPQDPKLSYVTYEVLREQFPQHIDEVDAYLITGSKFSVYEELRWIKNLMIFIRELHIRKKKVIGICFGHQLIAHALGGKTEKAAVGWNVGSQPHALNELGKSTLGYQNAFHLLVSHQDQVVVPAPGSEILATMPTCPIAMCTIGAHILTLQAHPEFEAAYAQTLLERRRERLGEAIYQKGMKSLEIKDDKELAADWMGKFLRGKQYG